jgi:hypothetical protein
LYKAVVTPIAERRTKGAWYRDGRLITLDGSTLDVADTVEMKRSMGDQARAADPSAKEMPS